MRQECRERFPRHQLQKKPLVNDPGRHHGTCVTHVPWFMSGSPTCGGVENVPTIPGACATYNFTYLARGPWRVCSVTAVKTSSTHQDLCTICTFLYLILAGWYSRLPISHREGYYTGKVVAVATLNVIGKSMTRFHQEWSTHSTMHL